MKLGLSRRKLDVVTAVVACPLLVLVAMWWSRPREVRTQRLEDGSLLVLTRVKFGPSNEFSHGGALEKVLGDWIPPNGLQGAGLKLQRPTKERSFRSGRPWLTAEFKVVCSNATTSPLLVPRVGQAGSPQWTSPLHQLRWVVGGETGVDWVAEPWAGFRAYRDGDFSYVECSRFARDSKWLRIRYEQRMAKNGPWRIVARFRVRNPAHPASEPWVAEAMPAVRMVNGVEFTLGEVTLETKAFVEWDLFDPGDIGNQTVNVPVRVRSNNVVLGNWSASRIEAEDASGNFGMYALPGYALPEGFAPNRESVTPDWSICRGGRGLDPRFVWKVEVDFCPTRTPESLFSPENQIRFRVPASLSAPLVTNVAGIPLEFRWMAEHSPHVKLLANRPDLRIELVPDGALWGQYGLGGITDRTQSVDVTVALVPNVHVTYYVQPKLVSDSGQNQPPPAESPRGKWP